MIIEERLELLSTAYLSKVFNDKDSSIHSELWESLLIFTKGMSYTEPTLQPVRITMVDVQYIIPYLSFFITKAFPQSWMIASKKKPMLPKLYAFLRAGGYGSVNVTYPSLLVLVDSLPSQVNTNINAIIIFREVAY